MLSKVADTITGVFTPLSVVFLCCLYLFCENIRKENGVTQLMRHNRFSDCCVALHPSAGISSEINGNARCYGGLLDLQHAVTCNVNSPRRSISTSRRKSEEIFEVELHASVKCNISTCLSLYDKCIARYRWRQAAESQNKNTSRHFMVSGGSNFLKRKRMKMFMNNIAFEQHYLLECYMCACWCLFGKEFSSDDAGDGPCPVLGIYDDWTLGYESPPPSQLFIRRAMSRFIFTKDELKSMNPLAWLSCLFYIAKLRIACRRQGRRHDIQRERITRTWKYVFRHKTIPPTFAEQVTSLGERSATEFFTKLALELGFEPPPPVCFSTTGPVTTKSKQENDYFPEVQCQLSDQSEQTPLSEREQCFKQQTVRTNPRKKCRMQTTRKKRGRKTRKKRSRCITRSFVITYNPDESVINDSFSCSNVSHPEGETQSCDHDKD